MIDTDEHIYSINNTNIHNKSNKDSSITKDIKYESKLFKKDVNEYKKDVLYRKTLIDKSIVNKSNLLHLYQMIGIIIL